MRDALLVVKEKLKTFLVEFKTQALGRLRSVCFLTQVEKLKKMSAYASREINRVGCWEFKTRKPWLG